MATLIINKRPPQRANFQVNAARRRCVWHGFGATDLLYAVDSISKYHQHLCQMSDEAMIIG